MTTTPRTAFAWVFAGLGLAPFLVAYGLLCVGALISLAVAGAGPAAGGRAATGGLAWLALFLLLAPMLVFIGLAWVSGRADSTWRRAVLLYAAAELLAFALLFVVFYGLGGASMAAAEGLVASRALAYQSLGETVTWLLLVQAVILPWTLIVVVADRRWGKGSSSLAGEHLRPRDTC